MNEYLVTGGLGFIGSHLTEELLKDENNRVWIIDDSTNAVWNPRRGRLDANEHIRDLLVQLMGGYEVTSDPRNPRLVCVGGDFAHRNVLDLIRSARFSGVFHLAGHCSVTQSIDRPKEYIEHNLMKTLELAKACAEGQTRLVFSSSAAVYGYRETPAKEDSELDPTNPYGATKMSAENWFRVYQNNYGLDYVVLRYFNVFGPRQSAGSPYAGVIANWVHNIWMKKPLIVYGDGHQTRDFVSVHDVARANIKAMEFDSHEYPTFNICSGIETNLNEVIDSFKEMTKHSFEVKHEKARESEVRSSVGDNKKALDSLEWKPEVGLYEGLKKMLSWRGVECNIE
jgi:UDP-glucose 4-epimerase